MNKKIVIASACLTELIDDTANIYTSSYTRKNRTNPTLIKHKIDGDD